MIFLGSFRATRRTKFSLSLVKSNEFNRFRPIKSRSLKNAVKMSDTINKLWRDVYNTRNKPK